MGQENTSSRLSYSHTAMPPGAHIYYPAAFLLGLPILATYVEPMGQLLFFMTRRTSPGICQYVVACRYRKIETNFSQNGTRYHSNKFLSNTLTPINSQAGLSTSFFTSGSMHLLALRPAWCVKNQSTDVDGVLKCTQEL